MSLAVITYCINPVYVMGQDNRHNLVFSFNNSLTGPYLCPPQISGVINDANDPAATKGIILNVKEGNNNIPSSDYSISVESSDTSIVGNNNVVIEKYSGKAAIMIKPSKPGYTDITLSLKKSGKTATLLINYGASANIYPMPSSNWHTGMGDASAAIAMDRDFMIVGDDETNQLCVYNRNVPGLPLVVFNYENMLSLTDGTSGDYKEIDCEAGARSLRFPENVYWTGSMSNGGKRFEVKPNRSCLFSTTITGTGASTKIRVPGFYNDLRKQLIKWGIKNGYKMNSAAADGETPKKIDGFNIEGIAFAPDSTTLYIGFRAPLVPLKNRQKALIAPIDHFEDWFNNGHPHKNPLIGSPIELELDGRGIRDMIRLNNGSYIIVAGSCDEKRNGSLYTWSGNRNEQPVLSTLIQHDFNAEGGIEVDDEKGNFTGKIQLISDDGTADYYNDGISNKHLPANFKKFKSMIVELKK